jgi:hypothetical protein
MNDSESSNIEHIVGRAMQDYEEELRRVKKNVLRTPALDGQFVSFCQDVYTHYNAKCIDSGEDPIITETESREFIDDFVVAYNEFFTLIDMFPKLKALHEQKDPKQFVFNFLSNLLDRSFGFKYEFVNKNVGYKITDTPERAVPPKINLFKVIRHLIDTYHDKYSVEENQKHVKHTRPTEFEELQGVTYVKNNGSEITTNLCAEFNTNFWKNIFHDVSTCRFNFGDHNVGSYLDSADPSIHYLCVKDSSWTNDGAEIPSPLALAILHESKDKRKNKYLVVEGVFGNEIRNIRGTKEEPELGYKYLYDCLIKYAHETGRKLFFNVSFNTKHSSQGTFEFINYVAKRMGKDPVYTCVNREERVFNFNTEKYGRLESKWQKQYLRLESDFIQTDDNEKEKKDIRDKVLGLARYANLYFVANRLKAKVKRKKEESLYRQKVVGEVGQQISNKDWKKIRSGRRNDLESFLEYEISDEDWNNLRPEFTPDDHFYCAWSPPKGEARGLPLEKGKIRKEYKQLFENTQVVVESAMSKRLGGYLITAVIIGLATISYFAVKENKLHDREEHVRKLDQMTPPSLTSGLDDEFTLPEGARGATVETPIHYLVDSDISTADTISEVYLDDVPVEEIKETLPPLSEIEICRLSKLVKLMELAEHINLETYRKINGCESAKIDGNVLYCVGHGNLAEMDLGKVVSVQMVSSDEDNDDPFDMERKLQVLYLSKGSKVNVAYPLIPEILVINNFKNLKKSHDIGQEALRILSNRYNPDCVLEISSDEQKALEDIADWYTRERPYLNERSEISGKVAENQMLYLVVKEISKKTEFRDQLEVAVLNVINLGDITNHIYDRDYQEGDGYFTYFIEITHEDGKQDLYSASEGSHKEFRKFYEGLLTLMNLKKRRELIH